MGNVPISFINRYLQHRERPVPGIAHGPTMLRKKNAKSAGGGITDRKIIIYAMLPPCDRENPPIWTVGTPQYVESSPVLLVGLGQESGKETQELCG